MAKTMTMSEQLVGRRLPDFPKHIDTYMARYVRPDGNFCARLEPDEGWLKPAHRKARIAGWVRFTGLSFGEGMTQWQATDRGRVEATAAAARAKAIYADRDQWARDCHKAFAVRRAT